MSQFLRFCICLLCCTQSFVAFSFQSEDDILGTWVSEKKNVVINVYKDKGEFRAKILWFNDRDDPSQPRATRKDIHNPDESLRDRLIIGMDVLEGLTFNPKSHRWEKGKIYDPRHGKYWSSVVYFNKKNQMEVKGYWKFEFLSQTLAFDRYKK
ncbi:DUF2147 domain-containing protein [Pelobium manganitolerans]|nr:DUF2147 domain-containing protein [Pelobium manganitolerans]